MSALAPHPNPLSSGGEGARCWGPRSPSARWDVIVIGAGVGGLAAAGVLAKLGHRVLVLEQHTVPGGFSQSFRRAHWSWDVGLHVVGDVGPSGLAGRLFGALSGGRLAWNRIDGAWDEAELPGGPRIEYGAGLREHLLEVFPKERDGLVRYFRLMHQAAAAMRRRFIARTATAPGELALARTADVLSSVTSDPHLRAALALHWVFYGTPPERSAFGVHAMLARHYRDGAFYPHGGSMSLAHTFSAELQRDGGWVRTQADVEQLLVEHGRVLGVRLAGGEELRAPAVISAAGALNTMRLLPPEERVEEIEQLRPSNPHVCLHVGFRGDVRAAGATPTNRWLLDDLSAGLWDTETVKPPAAYIAFPSLKDGVSEQHHTAEIVAFTEWAPFARFDGSRWRHRGEGYDALKARLTERLLAVAFERLPKLRDHVAYTELSTPLSNAHFTRAVKGSAYGLDSSPERYACRALKPRTKVRGLHLAGSDVSMSGIAGALAGGLVAALSLEPERAGAWVRRVVRQPTKGGRHAEPARHRPAAR